MSNYCKESFGLKENTRKSLHRTKFEQKKFN